MTKIKQHTIEMPVRIGLNIFFCIASRIILLRTFLTYLRRMSKALNEIFCVITINPKWFLLFFLYLIFLSSVIFRRSGWIVFLLTSNLVKCLYDIVLSQDFHSLMYYHYLIHYIYLDNFRITNRTVHFYI